MQESPAASRSSQIKLHGLTLSYTVPSTAAYINQAIASIGAISSTLELEFWQKVLLLVEQSKGVLATGAATYITYGNKLLKQNGHGPMLGEDNKILRYININATSAKTWLMTIGLINTATGISTLFKLPLSTSALYAIYTLAIVTGGFNGVGQAAVIAGRNKEDKIFQNTLIHMAQITGVAVSTGLPTFFLTTDPLLRSAIPILATLLVKNFSESHLAFYGKLLAQKAANKLKHLFGGKNEIGETSPLLSQMEQKPEAYDIDNIPWTISLLAHLAGAGSAAAYFALYFLNLLTGTYNNIYSPLSQQAGGQPNINDVVFWTCGAGILVILPATSLIAIYFSFKDHALRACKIEGVDDAAKAALRKPGWKVLIAGATLFKIIGPGASTFKLAETLLNLTSLPPLPKMLIASGTTLALATGGLFPVNSLIAETNKPLRIRDIAPLFAFDALAITAFTMAISAINEHYGAPAAMFFMTAFSILEPLLIANTGRCAGTHSAILLYTYFLEKIIKAVKKIGAQCSSYRYSASQTLFVDAQSSIINTESTGLLPLNTDHSSADNKTCFGCC